MTGTWASRTVLEEIVGPATTAAASTPAGLAELDRLDHQAPDVPTPASRFVTPAER